MRVEFSNVKRGHADGSKTETQRFFGSRIDDRVGDELGMEIGGGVRVRRMLRDGR